MKVFYQGCALNNPNKDYYDSLGLDEVPLLTKSWFFNPPYELDSPIQYADIINFCVNGPNDCPRPLPQNLMACVDIEQPWRNPFNAPNQHTDAEAITAASKYLGAIQSVRRHHSGAIDVFKLMDPPAAYEGRRLLRRVIQSKANSLSTSCWRSGQLIHKDINVNFNIVNLQVQNQLALAAEFDQPVYGWIWAHYQGGGGIVPLDEMEQWLTLLKTLPLEGWIVLGSHTSQGRALVDLAVKLAG